MPNAGLPQRVEGRNIYLCSPEYMAQYARRFLWAGVRIVGGCCGTTPEHIKLIRSEARCCSRMQKTLQRDGGRAGSRRRRRCEKVPVAKKSQAGREAGGGKVRRVRRDSAAARRGRIARRSKARSCARQQGIDCINVPDGPRASARMSAQVTCQLIQQQAGIEAVQPFLLPRPQYSEHPIGAAGRAHGGRAQSDLHHRRSAAHGHLSGCDRGVRRGRHRAGQHRQQSESRAGYRRQSDGLADGAADRRGRESRAR